MITKFINRQEELSFLEQRFAQKTFEFIPLYGRRRVGKTELLLHFIRKKKAIYFQARVGTKRENIERFKNSAKEHVDLTGVIEDWEAIFLYIKQQIKERIIIVIDEFPYLLETEQGLSSVFQRIIDLRLQGSNMMLLFCGSSLSVMHKEVLTYKAPLYGRRTGQLELRSLSFKECIKFFDKSFEEIIGIYAVCGGTPAYLKEFIDKKPLFALVKEKILLKGALLREEIPFLLREELRDPRVYLSILSSIALGQRKLGDILNYSGMKDKTSITPYLQTLENLLYIQRELPVTEKITSKKGLYYITDIFFLFWLRFVRMNSDLVERDVESAVVKIKREFPFHVSFIFENICKECLWEKRLFSFEKIGRWWYQEHEIDIVGIGEKKILFGECKWKDNVDGEKILTLLKQKISVIPKKNNKTEYFYIFAKSFSRKTKQKNVFFFDLQDMEKIFTHKN